MIIFRRCVKVTRSSCDNSHLTKHFLLNEGKQSANNFRLSDRQLLRQCAGCDVKFPTQKGMTLIFFHSRMLPAEPPTEKCVPSSPHTHSPTQARLGKSLITNRFGESYSSYRITLAVRICLLYLVANAGN